MTINEPLTDTDLRGRAAELRELADEILQGIAGWRAAAASEGYRGLFGRALSMSHIHVMFSLHKQGSLRMSELASVLDISVANATGIVTRMEERGLVTRARDIADRRVVNLTLTEEGRALVENMDRRRREFFIFLLSRLSVHELTQLRDGMRAMFRASDEAMARHEVDQPEPQEGQANE